MIENRELEAQPVDKIESLQDGWVAPVKNGHKAAHVAAEPVKEADNQAWQENLQEGWSPPK